LRIQRVVNSDAAAAAALTIHNSANFTYSGSLGGTASGSVSAASTPGSTNGDNFSLIKSGAGTFTASGTLTYKGNTTVNQGMLTLGSANGNNQSSSVTIASSGATLNLAFTGTDTVGKLFIGGSQMAAGVYEAVGNPGSGIEISQITGTGTLTVTSGPLVGYELWKSVNGTNQSFDQDHDTDGVQNGIEYFLGGASGNANGFTAVPGVTQSAEVYSITWTKAADYTGMYGSGFVVESANAVGGPWTAETLGAAVTISGNNVKYTFPAGGPRKFVRLRVVEP
jgi:autotransporter-associated beta strand protein